MAEMDFRLPYSSLQVIEQALQGYLKCGGDKVKLTEAAKRAALHPTMVSRNNKFLASIGIIEGGHEKSLTTSGKKVALGSEHPQTPDYREAWSSVVNGSEHLQKILDAVQIRKGMNTEALNSHIVLTAGVPKSGQALTGARTIVDILIAAGRLEEDDGVFKAVTRAVSVETHIPVAWDETGEIQQGVPPLPGAGQRVFEQPVAGSVRPSGNDATTININININIDVSDVTLEGLGALLRELIKDLSRSEEK